MLCSTPCPYQEGPPNSLFRYWYLSLFFPWSGCFPSLVSCSDWHQTRETSWAASNGERVLLLTGPFCSSTFPNRPVSLKNITAHWQPYSVGWKTNLLKRANSLFTGGEQPRPPLLLHGMSPECRMSVLSFLFFPFMLLHFGTVVPFTVSLFLSSSPSSPPRASLLRYILWMQLENPPS